MAGFASQLATTRGTNDRFLRMGLLPVTAATRAKGHQRLSWTEISP